MSNNRPWRSQSLIVGAAIVLILVTGLIHLVEGPDQFSDAAYVGVLFFLNAGAAALAAVGIYRGAKTWGWGLGLLVAGGAWLLYLVSRTVGLPGLEVAPWEPIGVLSLVVEGLFVVLSIVYLTRYPKAPTSQAASTRVSQHRRIPITNPTATLMHGLHSFGQKRAASEGSPSSLESQALR